MATSEHVEREERVKCIVTVVFLFVLPSIFFWRQTLGWLTLADGDAIFWFYPAYQFVAEQLKQGHLPLWNPYLYSGTPLFAQWQAGVLDPLNWIFLLGLSERTLTFVQELSFSVALLGMYGYMRQLAVRRRAAVLAAIVYALSGFAVARSIYPGFLHIFALTPWVFFFLERVAQRRRWRDAAGGAFIVAWQLFAAHPQPFIYAGVMAGAYAIFRMDWRVTNWREFVRANRIFAVQSALIYGGGLCLAAWQMLPVIETARQSVRQEWPYELFTFNSLHPVSLLGTLFPYLHGQGRGIYQMSYWGVYWHHIEAAIYLGLIALTLALAGSWAAWRWRWSMARFWSVVAFVAVLLALGRYVGPLARVLYHIPVWGQLRSPNRHWLEVIFAVAVLCGLTVNHLLQDTLDEAGRWLVGIITRAGLALAVVAMAVGGFLLWRRNTTESWMRHLPDFKDLPPHFLRNGQAEFWVPMVTVAVMIMVLAYFLRAPQQPLRFALLLLAVVLDFQLYAHFAPISNPDGALNPKLGNAVPPSIAALERSQPPFRLHQMLAPGGSEFNPFWLYGHEFISGYDPLLNTRYKTFTRIDEAGRSFSKTLLEPQDTTLDLLNTRYVMIPPGFMTTQPTATNAALLDAARWRPVANDSTVPWYNAHQVYENLRALPRVWLVGEVLVVRDWYQQLQLMRGEIKDESGRAFDPARMAIADWTEPKKTEWTDWQALGLQAGATEPFAAESAKIIAREPGHLVIEADAPRAALLVISELANPGWHATVDGKAVNWHRVNYMLCGLPLAAGKHRVEFLYRPASIKTGAIVTFTTALCLLGLIGWDWRKRP